MAICSLYSAFYQYNDFNCNTFFYDPMNQFWKFLHSDYQGGGQSITVLCGNIIFWVTFSPVILRALNFNLFCLLIKHTICEPKIWYCRIAQCHSGILPGDLSEGIFKIDSLGHKRINKHFLKSSRRAYWTWSITKYLRRLIWTNFHKHIFMIQWEGI